MVSMIRKRWLMRMFGNWITAFLSPLIGTTIAFRFEWTDANLEIIFISLVSSTIVTVLIVGRELEKWGFVGRH